MTILHKTGATPAKLALVAALAVSLIVVLIVQFGSGADETVSASDEKQAVAEKHKQKRNAKKSKSPAKELSETRVHELRVWPNVEREEVAAFNPFVLPESLAVTARMPSDKTAESSDAARRFEAERQRREQRQQRRDALLSELKSAGAHLVVMSEKGPIALIGDRRLRIGDTVEGLRVKDITAQGVVLVEIDQ